MEGLFYTILTKIKLKKIIKILNFLQFTHCSFFQVNKLFFWEYAQ